VRKLKRGCHWQENLDTDAEKLEFGAIGDQNIGKRGWWSHYGQ
jgi:hypothetical protein